MDKYQKAKSDVSDYWKGKTGNEDDISKTISAGVDWAKGLVGAGSSDATTSAIQKRKQKLESSDGE